VESMFKVNNLMEGVDTPVSPDKVMVVSSPQISHPYLHKLQRSNTQLLTPCLFEKIPSRVSFEKSNA
jgi:hypothetical protein